MFIIVRIESIDEKTSTAKCFREADNMCIVDARWCQAFGASGKPGSGERAALTFVGGIPYLLFKLDSQISANSSQPAMSMGSGTAMPSVTSGGTQAGTTGSNRSPSDSVPGDHTLGGGVRGLIVAMLGGGIMLKAHALSSIFLSRLAALVRITSRRHELITDASTEVHANVGNATYRYEEVYASLADQRANQPAYVEATGATNSALALQAAWQGATAAVEDEDPIVYVQQATHTSAGRPTSFQRTISAGGEEVVHTGNVTITTNGTSVTVEVAGDAPTSLTIVNNLITATVDEATYVLSPEHLTSNRPLRAPDFIIYDGTDELINLVTHKHGGVIAGGSDTGGPKDAP